VNIGFAEATFMTRYCNRHVELE